jgi:hypothetical protein
MPQLMTRRVRKAGSAPSTIEDLIESISGERMTATAALEDNEDLVRHRRHRTLTVQIGR